MLDFKAKMQQIPFWLGVLTVLPQPSAGYQGLTSMGRLGNDGNVRKDRIVLTLI